MKNAIKFSPDGGRVVVRSSVAGGQFQVSIKDEGVGISAEALPRIFNAFEQGGIKVTQRFGGLGLGLAIAKAVVELHGGAVRAHSAGPGQGATFTLSLPTRAVTSAGAPAAPADPGAKAPLPFARLRVLLVDDHADTLKIMQRLLESRGLRVTTAGSVDQALKNAAGAEFDLLISDIGLPDGSGHELLSALRKITPVPAAIALSGYGAESDLRESNTAGFSAHLTKPIKVDRLWEAIRSLSAPDAIAE